VNQFYCEKEKEIIEALRCGTLGTELERHASCCAICSDIVAVSEFLQSDLEAPLALPSSDYVWWKGQLASKQMAVERATRSIALVKKISYLGMGVVAGWLVMLLDHFRPITGALSNYEIWSTGGLRESALCIGVAAVFLSLLGSLYFVRSEK
jgi:Putative silver efflux pump